MSFLKHFLGAIDVPHIGALSVRRQPRNHPKRGKLFRWDVFFHRESGKKKHHTPVKAAHKKVAQLKANRLSYMFGGKDLIRVTVRKQRG